MSNSKPKWINYLLLLGVMAIAARTGVAQNEKVPQQAIQGNWTVLSITYGDIEIKGTAKNPMRVTFNQDRMVTSPCYSISYKWSLQSSLSDSQSIITTTIEMTNRDLVSTIRLNPSKVPGELDVLANDFTPLKKGIDFQQSNSENTKARQQKGIYRFNKEELEISLGVPTGVRPPDFSGGNHATVIRLIREKK